MKELKLDRQRSNDACDICASDDVATVRLADAQRCLSCLVDYLDNETYIVEAGTTDCDSCGDNLIREDYPLCNSCGNHDECCRNDDCHENCNEGSCTNCGNSSPELCEQCFRCSSCDEHLAEEMSNGKAMVMHEKCFEEVKKDAETLVAAEPAEQYEVTW